MKCCRWDVCANRWRALLRTDIVIVTKCPTDIRPGDVSIIYDNLKLFPFQRLYFSHYRYGHLVSVFPDEIGTACQDLNGSIPTMLCL